MSQPSQFEDALREHIEKYFQAVEHLPPDQHYKRLTRILERPIFTVALKQTNGNKTKTAKLLGLSRNTLRIKLNELDLLQSETSSKSTYVKLKPVRKGKLIKKSNQ